MRSTIRQTCRVLAPILGSFILLALTSGGVSSAIKVLPNPVLMITGTEYFEAGGKQFTRYKFSVENRADYPDELFAPAPTLPPCGANTNSSRTWVDFYGERGNRLNGFCALKKAGLGEIYLIWKQASFRRVSFISSYSIGRPTPSTSPIWLKLRNREWIPMHLTHLFCRLTAVLGISEWEDNE